MKKSHACMIAGTHSGVGKTTWTLAVSMLARAKNLEVQPFKAGPDYIDPSFHHQISNSRRSRNLDLFLLSEETVQRTFVRNSSEVDLAIVEGVMGLFDGRDFKGEASSAEIAKLLNLPVFLVVDGSGLAASAAAVVYGFQKLDPQVRLAGVFFNRVNQEGHYQYLKQAVEFRTGVPCFGYLPQDAEIAIPERHLGLQGVAEMPDITEKIQNMAGLLGKHFEWEKFLEIAQTQPLSSSNESPNMSSPNGFVGDPEMESYGFPPKACGNDKGVAFARPFKIAVARDEAFSFYYEDNFDLLKEAGARLSFFSPLHDTEFPQADLLYFGGGFPELYAAPLSSNVSMLSQIRNFYRDGGWIYAECGGLMYLSQAFCDSKGQEFSFAGLVPGKTRMSGKLQNFGYKELEAAPGNFLFPHGAKIRSHEFHHSLWDGEGKYAPAYIIGERREGFTAPRLVASYQHLHFGSAPGLAGSLIHHIVKERNFVC